MSPVIGVDGGGTHVRAAVFDERGRELGRAESPGAVVSVDTAGVAARSVSDAVRRAAENAGITLPVPSLWAGLAGAGAEHARRAVAHELEAAALAERLVVGTDVEAAFHDVFRDRPGILLMAGTGSIAWARSEEGGTVRVGGWGERIGDEGSGFAIGIAAARSVARARDGRGRPTALTTGVLEHLSTRSPEDLVGWIASATKAEVAALAPVVLGAAEAGDPVAGEIVELASAELSEHVRTALERTAPWSQAPEVVLAGGLLEGGGGLARRVAETLAASDLRIRSARVDAARGAAWLASGPSS